MSVTDLVEVRLKDPDDFLVVKETLTRIGIPSEKDGIKVLTQTCHILHKRGKYYITHFKEMFILDGKESSISDEDVARRNTIAYLLDRWGLCEVVNASKIVERVAANQFKVVPFKEKSGWSLRSKYEIGKKKSSSPFTREHHE